MIRWWRVEMEPIEIQNVVYQAETTTSGVYLIVRLATIMWMEKHHLDAWTKQYGVLMIYHIVTVSLLYSYIYIYIII